jgi:hypothetical protein
MNSFAVRRAAALILPILSAWLIWVVLIAPPLDQIASDREDMSQRRRALHRYERLTREIPMMKRHIADMHDASDDGAYLPLSSPALMSTQLQDRVNALVSSTGALVRTNRTLPAVIEGGFERVSVELALAADATDLRDLLRALSSARPVIVVERLAAQTPETDQPRDSDVRPTFETVLTLASFAKPGNADVAASP